MAIGATPSVNLVPKAQVELYLKLLNEIIKI